MEYKISKDWYTVTNRRKIAETDIQRNNSAHLSAICEAMYADHIERITGNNLTSTPCSQIAELEAEIKEGVESSIVRKQIAKSGQAVWAFHKEYLHEVITREEAILNVERFISAKSKGALANQGIHNGFTKVSAAIEAIAARFTQSKTEDGMLTEEARNDVNTHIARKLADGNWAIHPDFIDILKQELAEAKQWTAATSHVILNTKLDISFGEEAYNIAMERFRNAKVQELKSQFPSEEDAAEHVERYIVKLGTGNKQNARWEINNKHISELKRHLYDPRVDTWLRTRDIETQYGVKATTVNDRNNRYSRAMGATLEKTGLSTPEASGYVKKYIAEQLTIPEGGRALFINPKHVDPILTFSSWSPIRTQLSLPKRNPTLNQAENVDALRQALLQASNRDISL